MATIRMPLKTFRIKNILISLGEFNTVQSVSLDAINKKIQDIFDEKPEIKKVVDDALKLYPEPDKTAIDEL